METSDKSSRACFKFSLINALFYTRYILFIILEQRTLGKSTKELARKLRIEGSGSAAVNNSILNISMTAIKKHTETFYLTHGHFIT